MAWNNSITNVLNIWADMGVFAYVIPFLLIFAVVFGILHKTQLFGKDNRSINAIIALSIALLSLQFDYVSTFFAEIFPKFGVGLAVFLVLVILTGFFVGDSRTAMSWIGYLTGIGVVVWALVNWDFWRDNWSIAWWLEEYFWPLLVLAGVIAIVVVVANTGRPQNVVAANGPGVVTPQ